MKAETYTKQFTSYEKAYEWMVMKNQINKNPDQLFCLVDGPDNGYSVVDLNTAIDLGMGYTWSVNRLRN